VDNSNQRLSVEFIRRRNDPSLNYSVKFTDNLLETWNTVGSPTAVTPIDPVWERVLVHDSQTTNDAQSRFGRVYIMQN
jgi:hypothetical protein